MYFSRIRGSPLLANCSTVTTTFTYRPTRRAGK
jgi:hypothetical protein